MTKKKAKIKKSKGKKEILKKKINSQGMKRSSLFSNKKKKNIKKKNIKKKKEKKISNRVSKNKKKILTKKIAVSQEKKFQKKKKVKVPEKKVIEVSRGERELIFKPKIRVIGVGGGGGAIVSEIKRFLEKSTFLIADTDLRSLEKRKDIKHFWFGEKLTHGLGSGGNIEIAKKAAEEAKEKIISYLKDQDIIIFIASLGGGVGSGSSEVFAQAAQKLGNVTFGIFTLPFKFEGKLKSKLAYSSLKRLRELLNVSIAIPNERIFKVIKEDTPLTEAFSIVNKNLVEYLESLIDLIFNPGIINIDFADLKTILKGKGNYAFLNVVKEGGKDRVEKTCQKILFNPLLQYKNFTPEKILFNISGDESLSMLEVEKISNFISKENPQAKIIFGISKDNSLKNKIKTTILMTGGAKKEKENIKSLEEITHKKEKEKKKVESLAEEKQQREEKKEIEKVETEIEKEHLLSPSLPLVSPSFSSDKAIKKVEIMETTALPAKKVIRRSGLEIKKAEELEEKKRLQQEEEWEIPAFLRKIKFNK